MAIDVVSAQAADRILPVLAERLQMPQNDPFAPDVVVVPGVGISDWLQEQLAIRFGPHGIVANTKFWLPNEFNSIAGSLSPRSAEMLDATEMQWLILEFLSQEEAAGREPVPGFVLAKRKLSFAKRVADLLDRYSVHRPEMILDWISGKDTDGSSALPEQQMWQPTLWRQLQSMVAKTSDASRSQTGAFLATELQNARITFFGLESFSRAKVELLKQIGATKDVKILHLSPIDGLISSFRAEDFIVGEKRRDQDLSTRLKNPLLRSWSRSALECAALLSTVATTAESIVSDHPATVLGALQSSLSQDLDQVMTEKQKDLLQQSDGSVQIHLCHGATRQVEVLRDALLHLLKSDRSLRPRDILILCTDLEKYSPLLEPILGAQLGSNGMHLPISIVEKSNVTATPVAVAVDAILSLAAGRCSVLEVVEALTLGPIRTKFGFDEDEILLISEWATQLNVKWGLDSEHRSAWNYSSEFEEGTWQLAVDRLVTGLMLQSEKIEEHLPGVAGFDDLSGSNIETVGKLFAFHHALKQLQVVASTALVAGDWAKVLSTVTRDFVEVQKEERQHLLDVASVVRRLQNSMSYAPTALFALSEFREYVTESLPSVRSSSLKWADVVRVASPHRLRGVSARVVAVLGFDDDAFRGGSASGDDILSRDPRLGERDLRSDERLGLLTMIHSAREHLVITCNGHDVNNNKSIPLAVPMEELKDAIALAISTLPPSSRKNKPVLIHHSRQLADAVNIALHADSSEKNVQSLLGDGEAWTFDSSAVDIVKQISLLASSSGGNEDGFGYPVLPPPIEKEVRTEVRLQDFHDAIRRPVDVFVNQRLGILLPRDVEAVEDDLPLWPNSLSYSEIGRELLQAVQEGETADSWKKRKHLSGGLPLGVLADAVWKKIEDEVAAIVGAAQSVLQEKPRSVAVSASLTDEELLAVSSGKLEVVDHVTTHGNTVLLLNFSTWSKRMRVLPWLQISALTAQDPEQVWTALVIAKAPKVKSKAKNAPPQQPFYSEEFVLAGENSEERYESAIQVLEFANKIRTRARRVPLPLFERSSWLLDLSATELRKELGYDLDRPSHNLVFGERTLEEFQSEPLIDSIDVELPPSSSRFEAYASWLTRTWENTVRVVKEAEPPKTKAGAAKKKNSAAGETEDATNGEES